MILNIFIFFTKKAKIWNVFYINNLFGAAWMRLHSLDIIIFEKDFKCILYVVVGELRLLEDLAQSITAALHVVLRLEGLLAPQ